MGLNAGELTYCNRCSGFFDNCCLITSYWPAWSTQTLTDSISVSLCVYFLALMFPCHIVHIFVFVCDSLCYTHPPLSLSLLGKLVLVCCLCQDFLVDCFLILAMVAWTGTKTDLDRNQPNVRKQVWPILLFDGKFLIQIVQFELSLCFDLNTDIVSLLEIHTVS